MFLLLRYRLVLFRYIITILLFCLSPLWSFGQDSFLIQYENQGDTIRINTSDIKSYTNSLVDSLYEKGHWFAAIDSLQKEKVVIYRGPKFRKFSLKGDSIINTIYKDLRLSQCNHLAEWNSYGSKIGDYFGNEGFPFAKVLMDSISIQDEQLFGHIHLDKGPQIFMDSIYLSGDARINRKYLYKYLEYEPLGQYHQDRLNKTEDLLKALPFVELNEKPKIKFLGDFASLHLDLKHKNASRLDFLVGINPSTEDGEQRFFVSLDLEAELVNQLNRGEYISIKYARLQRDNNEIELKLRFPYPLDLPLAINGSFSLFRNALNFQDVDSEIGVAYLLNSVDYIGLSWEFDSSRLINIDTVGIINSGKLPESLDVANNGLSLYGRLQRYNNNYNPTRGWGIQGKFKASTKEILENNSIQSLTTESIDFSNAYDTLDTNGFQFTAEFRLDKYFEIGQNFSLHSNVKTYWLFSDLTVYNNELKRIGGNRILKGFDEEAFLAEIYIVPSLSLNLILDERSFLSIPFVEYGVFKNQDGDWQNAIGVGAGINFQTRAGLLNFSLASGKFRDNPFNIRNPKVHIGFLSVF